MTPFNSRDIILRDNSGDAKLNSTVNVLQQNSVWCPQNYPSELRLNIQVTDLEGMLFDKRPSGLHLITHENGENIIRQYGIF